MQVHVIRVPYDSGHLRKRMGLGPDRIFERLPGLLTELDISFESEEILVANPYPAEINTAFELARNIAGSVSRCRVENRLPILLSGNCNAAVGTVSGCGSTTTGIVWFDAHGESTTPETTTSGFLDGMPISILLGRSWQTLANSIPGFTAIPGNRIVLFGGRDLDNGETALLEACRVRRAATVEQLAGHVSELAADVEQLYVHVDLDVLDPSVAHANHWATPGGITLETLLDAITEIRNRSRIAALGIASYDPGVDGDRRALHAALEVVTALLRPASSGAKV